MEWEVAAWRVVALLAEAAVRTALMAAVIAVALKVLRVDRPNVRLLVWTAFLYGAIALIPVRCFAPQFELPMPALTFVSSLPSWAKWDVADRSHLRTPSSVLFARGARPDASADAPQRQDPSGPGRWTFLAVIALSGSLFLWIRLCAGWFVANRAERNLRAIDDPLLLSRLTAHLAHVGMRQRPRLAESPGLVVPIKTSVWRPLIVLPAAWREWSTETLDAVLVHELAHVSRRDVLTQRLALLFRAVFWFSPLSWWLQRHMAELAEEASDEAALGAGVDPAAYAAILLGFFAMRTPAGHRMDWHLAMARGGATGAVRRVELVLSWDGRRNATFTRPFGWIAAGSMLSALAMTATAAASSDSSPKVETSLRASGTRHETAARVPDQLALPDRQLGSFSATPKRGSTRIASTVSASSIPSEPFELAVVSPAVPLAIRNYPFDVPGPPAAPAHAETDSPPEADQDPILLRKVDPAYTAEAMKANLQGTVLLSAVVLPDGSLGDIALARSLDRTFGLDDRAIEAARGWRFQPATRMNLATNQREAVPARVQLELTFRLR